MSDNSRECTYTRRYPITTTTPRTPIESTYDAILAEKWENMMGHKHISNMKTNSSVPPINTMVKKKEEIWSSAKILGYDYNTMEESLY